MPLSLVELTQNPKMREKCLLDFVVFALGWIAISVPFLFLEDARVTIYKYSVSVTGLMYVLIMSSLCYMYCQADGVMSRKEVKE